MIAVPDTVTKGQGINPAPSVLKFNANVYLSYAFGT
jgi:hypothetical protein